MISNELLSWLTCECVVKAHKQTVCCPSFCVLNLCQVCAWGAIMLVIWSHQLSRLCVMFNFSFCQVLKHGYTWFY